MPIILILVSIISLFVWYYQYIYHQLDGKIYYPNMFYDIDNYKIKVFTDLNTYRQSDVKDNYILFYCNKDLTYLNNKQIYWLDTNDLYYLTKYCPFKKYYIIDNKWNYYYFKS